MRLLHKELMLGDGQDAVDAEALSRATLDHRATPSPDGISRAQQLLTRRQYDAWQLSITGSGYKQIAIALRISPSTARDRVRRAEQILEQDH